MATVKIEITTGDQHCKVQRDSGTEDLPRLLLSALAQIAENVPSPRMHAMVDAAWGALLRTPEGGPS